MATIISLADYYISHSKNTPCFPPFAQNKKHQVLMFLRYHLQNNFHSTFYFEPFTKKYINYSQKQFNNPFAEVNSGNVQSMK